MEFSAEKGTFSVSANLWESYILRILGGSSQLGYVVNNHGDRKSPKDRAMWDPFQMAELHGFLNGFPTTYKSWDDPPSTHEVA